MVEVPFVSAFNHQTPSVINISAIVIKALGQIKVDLYSEGLIARNLETFSLEKNCN